MKAITKEVIIAAPATMVWKHLTDSDKLAAWLMPNDFEPVKRHAFTLRCEPEGDWDGIIYCVVKELLPPEKMVWSWKSDQISLATTVTFTLSEADGKTTLTLIHSGWDALPAEEQDIFKKYKDGWDVYIRKNLPRLLH